MSSAATRRWVWRLTALIAQCGVVGLVGAAWYLATRPGGVSPLLLPTPSAVAERVPELLAEGDTWRHIGITAREFIAAFTIAAVAGLSIGAWVAGSEYRLRLLEPIVSYLYMVPSILVYPLLLLIFGIGSSSKIAFGAALGVIPVTLNTLRGFRSVPPSFITAAQSMGATRSQLTWRIRLPASLPAVVAGLRVGGALSLIAVIVGEMLAARGGLGFEVIRTSQTFSIPTLYAYIVIVIALVTAVDMLMRRFEASQRHARGEE